MRDPGVSCQTERSYPAWVCFFLSIHESNWNRDCGNILAVVIAEETLWGPGGWARNAGPVRRGGAHPRGGFTGPKPTDGVPISCSLGDTESSSEKYPETYFAEAR